MLNPIDIVTGQDLVANLTEIASRVARDERLIVEHNGSRFALVSTEDLQRLEEADAAVEQQALANVETTKDDPDRPICLPFKPHSIESSPTR